ncbi:ribosomal protein S6 [Paracoccidioides brasiliensis Pb18]|uniref:Ribosomal protein S6 n=1 Tax=Paracoccidioides brasiliensis (strain Pb18) TaxID=502780 RepID=C1G4U8_PARBD|nr:ribosomal protein S6 [Paracoccidioides brasiliensis Pb18]EEH45814.2 ribosomal protein S6 [Paracoccidioides brasiliensis Pb18]
MTRGPTWDIRPPKNQRPETQDQSLALIARVTGLQILYGGGVIRGLTNWGPFRLPRPTTKHQTKYATGYHFIMRFDSSSAVQKSVRRTLGLDPRMIRFSVVKLGEKLEDIKDVGGTVEWNQSRQLIGDELGVKVPLSSVRRLE